MKIYECDHYGHGKDWVLASSVEEALEHVDGGDAVVTLFPEEKWKESFLTDLNEPIPDEDYEEFEEDDYICGYLIIESFADFAKREKVAQLIASDYE